MASSVASSSKAAANHATSADKLHTGLEHKARGNAAFTSGDIKAALASYHYAVLYLSGLQSRSVLGLMGENSGQHGKPDDLSSNEEEDEDGHAPAPAAQSEKELSTVHSNMAACYLKQQNFARAIQSADKALACDSGNVKAKFRKAQAMRLGGDIYPAQKFLADTIEKLRSRKTKETRQTIESFEKESLLVQKAIEQREVMARNKWKGFLGKNPKVFQVETPAAAGAEEVKNQQTLSERSDSKDTTPLEARDLTS